MKIKRYFIWAEGDRMGDSGWIPSWIPRDANFDPSDRRGIYHDMLEHGLNDRGTFADEVRAFGRIIAIRHETGVAINYVRNAYESLGQELHSLSQDEAGYAPFKAPRVQLWPEQAHMAGPISRVVKAYANELLREVAESDNGDDPDHPDQKSWITARCTTMANLLQIGYLDALRRYGSNIESIAWACKDFGENGPELPEGEDNDLLCVTFDTRECKFSMRTVSADYNGIHPMWARRRRAAFYRG